MKKEQLIAGKILLPWMILFGAYVTLYTHMTAFTAESFGMIRTMFILFLALVAIFGVYVTGSAYYETLGERVRNKRDASYYNDDMKVVFLNDDINKVIVEFSHNLVRKYELKKSMYVLSLKRYRRFIHPEDIGKTWINPRYMSPSDQSPVKFRIKLPNMNQYLWMYRKHYYELAEGYGYTAMDVTEQTIPESRSNEQEHDVLTGLLDRNGLYKAISRLTDTERAVSYFVDLRAFSEINDYYGHEIGDEILKLIAEELRWFEKETCMISRFSGDEFVIVCTGEQAQQDAIERHLEKLDAFAFSIHKTSETTVQINKSIGYAIYPDDTDRIEKLISLSSLAMKESAKQHRPSIQRYLKSMSDQLKQHVLVASKLREAIESDYIHVHFQKVIDVRTDELVFVEEMARWNDKELGYVAPKEFFSVAGISNLTHRLDRYLVKKALEQFITIRNKRYKQAKLSLNVAPSSLLDETFLLYLNQLVEQYNLVPSDICIEVSESTFVNNLEHCISSIAAYKEAGYLIALDDFGKEYSSLAILEQVAFDIIKIDAMFTKNIHEQKNQEIIKMIRKITELSDKLIIAEGVETIQQRDILLSLGCHLQQGFLLHKPQRNLK